MTRMMENKPMTVDDTHYNAVGETILNRLIFLSEHKETLLGIDEIPFLEYLLHIVDMKYVKYWEDYKNAPMIA